MYFSTREYDGFTLPAGRYDAVRVEIGAHAGKNWFCVLFPPMCVPAATSDGGQDMSAYSGAEQQAVCSSYKVGFAAVEWLEGLKESLSGQGVRTLAEADGQAEQDDEAQEEADGAEQDVRRADKKRTPPAQGRSIPAGGRSQRQIAHRRKLHVQRTEAIGHIVGHAGGGTGRAQRQAQGKHAPRSGALPASRRPP